MKRLVALAVMAATLAGCSNTQTVPPRETLQWEAIASVGERHVYSAATLDGVVYAIDEAATLWSYDPRSGDWRFRSELPHPSREAMLVAANGMLFLAGGETDAEPALDRFESYDPATDSWTRLDPLPVPVCMMGAIAQRGSIFVIGGDGGGGSGPARFVQRYDLATGSWSLGADMPTPRCGLALVEHRGKILATGGILFDSAQQKWAIVDQVELYDPTRDEWTSLPGLPAPRFRHAAVEFDGEALLIGGLELGAWQENPSRAGVLSFVPGSASWRERNPLEFARYAHAAVTLDRKLYVFGGRSDLKTIESSVERGTLR